ncbi:MAG: arsenate reductase family protein [Candidatus Azotimanducaceae bacterium]
MITVYHNPNCSKSRGVLAILQERHVPFDSVEYLKAPPSRHDLENILDLLLDAPNELVRKDRLFRELALNEDDCKTKEQIVTLLLRHPKLMERPVVVKGRKAIIARPSKRIEEFL